jgi:hypothetical protein
MDLFTSEDLRTLWREHEAPCVSIYLPTHRSGAEQDPIRLRKHLAEAEEKVTAAGVRGSEVRALLEPARCLLDQPAFWRGQNDGLALFLAGDFQRTYRLPLTFKDLVVVGKDFHITPLLPLLDEDRPFFVLALSHNAVRLLECTRRRSRLVEVPGVPANLAEAMRRHDSDASLQFHGRTGGEGAGGGKPIFFSHGGDIDHDKDELLRYCQLIDRGLERIMTGQRAPLVLAAVDYLHGIYRMANTYAHLWQPGIEGNPDKLSEQELRERAWRLVQPAWVEQQQRALAQYRQLAGTGETAQELTEVLTAAGEGHVDVLLVAAGHERWGRFDPQTHFLDLHALPRPGDADLLNLAAVQTLRHGGTVHLIGERQMPEGRSAAAVLRQPLISR